MTCVIDVNGKILDMMEPFKVGWKIYDVPVYTQESHGFTFYTRHIDLCLCCNLSLLCPVGLRTDPLRGDDNTKTTMNYTRAALFIIGTELTAE